MIKLGVFCPCKLTSTSGGDAGPQSIGQTLTFPRAYQFVSRVTGETAYGGKSEIVVAAYHVTILRSRQGWARLH